MATQFVCRPTICAVDGWCFTTELLTHPYAPLALVADAFLGEVGPPGILFLFPTRSWKRLKHDRKPVRREPAWWASCAFRPQGKSLEILSPSAMSLSDVRQATQAGRRPPPVRQRGPAALRMAVGCSSKFSQQKDKVGVGECLFSSFFLSFLGKEMLQSASSLLKHTRRMERKKGKATGGVSSFWQRLACAGGGQIDGLLWLPPLFCRSPKVSRG